MKTLVTVTLLVLALSAAGVQSWRSSDSFQSRVAACLERTGLTTKEISESRVRNEGCLLDCALKSGDIRTVIADYKAPCGPEDYHCVFDKCVPMTEEVDEAASNLYVPEIRILEAYLPDTDYTPATGQTDALVTVEMASGSEKFFDRRDILCNTPIHLDSLRPTWNFACKPGPMRKSARLVFRVTDSDQPTGGIEPVGTAVATLGELMEAGTRKLFLTLTPSGVSKHYYVKVSVKARNYLN